MKVWIVVYNYGLINEDVGVFQSLEEAKRAFREYTGFTCSGLLECRMEHLLSGYNWEIISS